MTTHHDHPLPTLGCHLAPCAGWSERMLADDDRDLEELVLTIERATMTLHLRQQAGTLVATSTEADHRRIARVVLASCSQRSTSFAVIADLSTSTHHHDQEQTP